MNYNLCGRKKEMRERGGGKAGKQNRADDACSARKCPETGKKDGERGRNVDGTQFVGEATKGFY